MQTACLAEPIIAASQTAIDNPCAVRLQLGLYLFCAVVQNAAAGGAGAILVNGVAAGTATGAAIAATAPGLIKAMQEGKREVTIDDVTYKIDDKGREQSPSPPGP
jgi:hypothetical protein